MWPVKQNHNNDNCALDLRWPARSGRSNHIMSTLKTQRHVRWLQARRDDAQQRRRRRSEANVERRSEPRGMYAARRHIAELRAAAAG